MLPEDRARELLQRAALTIDVAPTGPVTAPAAVHRWRVPVAAAVSMAAVVAVVTGVVVGTRDRTVDPASPDPGAVPVLGLLRDDAVDRLQAAGLEVRVTTEAACAPDGAALAVTAQPGGSATLLVNDLAGADLDCPVVSDEAWAFVGMLNGGPEVPVTRPVQLRVDGGRPTYLGDTEVADIDAWGGPAATALRSALADPETSMISGPLEACADPRLPATGADGPGVLLVRPADPCGTRLALGLDVDGVARRIGVTTSVAPAADEVPDLRGLSEAEARLVLARLPDPVELSVVYSETGCDASAAVSSQQPPPGTRNLLQEPVVAFVDVVAPGCSGGTDLTPAKRELARSLIGLAETDGTGDVADLAPRIELFVGHARVGTAAPEAADTWRGCPPGVTYSASSCPVRLLSGLQSDAVNDITTAVRSTPVSPPCGGGLAAPALPLRIAAMESFFLTPPDDVSTCASFYRLQVFVDADGRIAALDLVLSEP